MADLDIGLELFENIIDANNVRDRVRGMASAVDGTDAQAIGIENTELGNAPNSFSMDLGGNRDRIDGRANARAGQTAIADGIRNSGQIELGAQNDSVRGTAKARTNRNGQSTFATGINSTDGGVIRGGDGRDNLRARATARGQDNVGAFGVLVTATDTEGGNDRVRGNAVANGISSTDARGVSVGFSDIDDDTTAGNPPGFTPTISGEAEVGQLSTGEGNDTIEGTANVNVNARNGDTISFAGGNGIVNDGGTVEQLEELLGTIGKTLDNFNAEDVEQIIDQLETSTLDMGAGNDRLNARVNLNVAQDGQGADDDLEVIGDGIENAGDLLLGNGDDAVNSTVSVNTTVAGAKGLANALDNSSVGIIDAGLGIEVNNETLFDLGAGNDTFTSNIFATAVDDLSAADGLGNRGTFVAGAGNDTFNLTAESRLVLENENDDEQQEGIADGWENRSRVFLDDQEGRSAGNDSVTTNAQAFGEGVLTIAEGLESRAFFDAGGGSDTLELTATATTGEGALVDNLTQASGLQTEQIDEGEFFLGEGNNSVVGNATANSEAVSGESEGTEFTPSTFAFGITQMTADANNTEEGEQGLIEAGDGNDLLEGTAIASGETDVAAFGVLLENAVTHGGNDTVQGTATVESANEAIASGIAVGLAEDVFLKENSLGRNYGLGAEAGTLSTGAGIDTLEAVANATALLNATARGIDGANGNIDLGTGNDTVIAEAIANTTSEDGTREAFGIFGGTISAGAGADTIKARSNGRLSGEADITLEGGQGFGGGAEIDMGTGNDALLGFGDAQVDGGAGTDTLQFEFSLSEFVAGGGDIDFTNVNFSFGGATLETDNFEQFEFAAEFDDSQALGSSDASLQRASFTADSISLFDGSAVFSLDELEDAVAEIEAVQSAA